MSGYRDPERLETRSHTFRARYIRRDMIALAFFTLSIAAALAVTVPPKTDVHCLQVSRTCTVDQVYLGLLPLHDLIDLRGAVGPARVEGVGKGRHVVVQLEGGGDRYLGSFGRAQELVVQAITAFCLTRSDTDASNPGSFQVVLLVLGLVSSLAVGFGLGRERLDVTLTSDGKRVQAVVTRLWRRTRTLDFDLHELTAFEGRVQTRQTRRGGSILYYRLEARLPREREEMLPEQVDHPALHVLTAQLNHFLDTLPERRNGLGA